MNTTAENIDKEKKLDINSIRNPIKDDLIRVNQIIEEKLYSDVELIDQCGHYIVNSGGKRLRPILVLLSAGALSYEGGKHINLAAIIEFIHTATLLHDDVVDASLLRRGQKTANQRWGNEASVLVGDFLYSRAFQMMVEVGSMEIMEVLADATNMIAKGEVQQLLNRHNPDTSEDNYMEVINNKTARLFQAASQVGAIVSNAKKEYEVAMTEYGKNLGISYQLIDDVLDYSATSDDLGKNIGDDLAEGKPTLPLLYALWHGTDKQKSIIKIAIDDGGLENIEEIKYAIESTGALEYTAKQAKTYADKALNSLNDLPQSDYLDTLFDLTRFAVERTN